MYYLSFLPDLRHLANAHNSSTCFLAFLPCSLIRLHTFLPFFKLRASPVVGSAVPENRKGPSRKAGELDNRGSHFYLAMYWAEALANQTKDTELKAQFEKVAKELITNETKIVSELNDIQGKPANLGGYYEPNEDLINQVMRPSKTFNAILE